jgi:hypothetical protein
VNTVRKVCLTAADAARWDRFVEERGITMAALIRQGVEVWIAQESRRRR